jgi:hypothetical protein
MTTFRVAERRRFTTVDRETLNDERLSFRARGILVWLLDKPDNWQTSGDAIQRAGTEGRDAVRAALNELEALGYLVRTRSQEKATGRWMTETVIYESPGHTEDGFPGVGNPDVGEPGPLTKTDEQKTEKKSLSACADTFEQWWALYRVTSERPGSKGAASRMWDRLTVGERHLAKIAISRHASYIEEFPGRFVMPNGATWLHKRRWMDEAPQEPPKLQTNGHQGIDYIRSRLQEASNGA